MDEPYPKTGTDDDRVAWLLKRAAEIRCKQVRAHFAPHVVWDKFWHQEWLAFEEEAQEAFRFWSDL